MVKKQIQLENFSIQNSVYCLTVSSVWGYDVMKAKIMLFIISYFNKIIIKHDLISFLIYSNRASILLFSIYIFAHFSLTMH